jgi:predicted AAA+ superfamily ATPase
MKERIKQQQQRLQKVSYIPRDIVFDQDVMLLKKIISLVGPRRSWKTTFMLQIINELIATQTISRDQVVYVDFNDHIWGNFDFETLLKEYKTLFPYLDPFFFFDEIQEVDNMRTGIFSLYNLWYQVIITGSNSKVLSSELSTHFRGKWYEIAVHTLSFKEYCRFVWVATEHDSFDEQWLILHHFQQYLKRWWYPEIVLTNNNDTLKTNIIKTYMDIMIYKDLMERYKINNEYVLKFMIQKLIAANTKQININKCFNELKSKWIAIDKNTLYHIVDHLQSVFFVSLLKQQYKPQWFKKVYLMDTIYQTIYDMQEHNRWQKFETMIYRHLYRQSLDIHYAHTTQWKCDFVIQNKYIIQVCRERNDENNNRETSHLWANDMLIYGKDARTMKEPIQYKTMQFDRYLLW